MTAIAPYVDSPSERSLKILELEANRIARSALVPDAIRKSETPTEDLMLVGLTGQALGVTNLAMAVKHIHPIDGKTATSAALDMGVAEVRCGAVWTIVELSDERCVLRGRRRDYPASWPDIVIKFDVTDAMKAGLLDVTWTLWKKNQNGKSYPAERWTERGWEWDDPDLRVGGHWVDNRKNPPSWAKADNRDAKRSMREPWWKHRQAMLLARAMKLLAKPLGGAALVGLSAQVPVDFDLDVDDLADIEPVVADLGGGRFVTDAHPDDGIEDAEIVPTPATEEWAQRWTELCREARCDRETSRWLLSETCGTRVDRAADVPADLRAACEAALDRWVADMSTPADDNEEA